MKFLQSKKEELKIRYWLNRDVAESIHARQKLFLKFKTSKIHIDKTNLMKFIKTLRTKSKTVSKKKRDFYEFNLKPKAE